MSPSRTTPPIPTATATILTISGKRGHAQPCLPHMRRITSAACGRNEADSGRFRGRKLRPPRRSHVHPVLMQNDRDDLAGCVALECQRGLDDVVLKPVLSNGE